jgi:hypothetical protein
MINPMLPHQNARCCFFDGPLALYVHDGATFQQYKDAYDRLGRLLHVAAARLGGCRATDQDPDSPDGTLPLPFDDRRGSPGGEGG